MTVAAERHGIVVTNPDWIAIHALLTALSARGLHEPGRSIEVGTLATKVARGLGLETVRVREIEELVALHDVGLIGMPDDLLHKPGALDDAERERLWEHPHIGAAIVRSLESLAHLAPLVEAEHERWDGHGYPNNIAGETIPLASRIVLACDAYAAMLRPRADRPALSHEVACEVLRRNAGSQFCPTVVGVLVGVIDHPETAAPRHPAPAPAPEPEPEFVLPTSDAVVPPPASEQPRMDRRLFILAAVLGTVAGILWAFPLPSVVTRCPPAGEGAGWCTMQKAWLPAFVKVEAVMIAALLLAWLPTVGIPRLLRGGYRQPQRAWPDGTDPVLAAASWTVRRPVKR